MLPNINASLTSIEYIMAPASAKKKPETTPAGGYRFIPIEANTAFKPAAPPQRPPLLPNTQPPPGPPPSYSLYPYPPPGHPPTPVHYNPTGAAHPYFFPPVLAHQPGAHFPSPYPPPPPPNDQAAPPPNGQAPPPVPNPGSTPAGPPNASNSTPPTTATPAKKTAPSKSDTTQQVITTAEHILERAKRAAAQTPNPATNTNSTISNVNINPRYPPKGVNSAARPTTHPNPQALGLTRISPPPECRYPSPEVIATVVNAWSTSRGYRLSRQKSDRNAAGDMYKQYYLCTRHGRPTNTHKVTPETRQRKQRKSERIGCPMGLVVRAVEPSNPAGDWTVKWQLAGKSEWHNHGPATQDEVAAEQTRIERNERRKASRGLGNGKRGRRLKDPNKPARKRDRRKKKPEQEGVNGAGVGSVNGGAAGADAAVERPTTANDSVTSTASSASDEAQHTPLLQQDNEQQLPQTHERQLQQGHDQQLEQGHAQQLQQELTSSLQRHDLSALTQPQHQHQPQQQHQQQYSQSQHNSHNQLPLSQPTSQRARPQPQQQNYTNSALPNLWGLSNPNILTQHQQQQNQQQQQHQAYQGFAYAQQGSGGGTQGGMGYR